jgi:hypothetical protein
VVEAAADQAGRHARVAGVVRADPVGLAPGP